MNPILSALGNHLWQSTIVAAVAGLLALMLRKHGAHVRYWVWFTVSVKFLVPFSLLIGLGSAVRWRSVPPIVSYPSVAIVATEVTQPFVVSTSAPVRPSPVGIMGQYVPTLLFIAWLTGFLIIVTLWTRSWWRMRAIVRSASPVLIPSNIHALASPALLEPSVFGIFHPVLLVPANIQERLSEEQLESVVAHEMCHIQRRDNLLSSIHMTVAAIFWFYPVVWWLGSRLLEERERACDEQVIRQGCAPHVYAEGILQVCKSYLESPLRCVSGVSGPNLQRRIAAIVSGRTVHRLNVGRMLLLTASAIAALIIPFAVGMVRAFPMSQEITRPADTPKWEAVSVKPCKPGERGGGNRGAGGGVSSDSSPERLNIACTPVLPLIISAYATFANGHADPLRMLPIEGGPQWVKSDFYQINAKAEVSATSEMMRGPMLQVLLEDRFKLKIHSETREVPAYALRIAKNGPKLQPFKEGTCIPLKFGDPLPVIPRGELLCGLEANRTKGRDRTLDMYQVTVRQFSDVLRRYLGRPIIDDTGMRGQFEFHLEFAPDESTPVLLLRPPGEPEPPENEPKGPSIFTALEEQLGLKLESIKGPGEFLLIDSIERPTEN